MKKNEETQIGRISLVGTKNIRVKEKEENLNNEPLVHISKTTSPSRSWTRPV